MKLDPRQAIRLASTPTPAEQFLSTGSAELGREQLTPRQFAVQAMLLPAVAFLSWFLFVSLVCIVYTGAYDTLLHPVPVLLIYAVLVINAWRRIGTRTIVLDGKARQLVIADDRRRKSNYADRPLQHIPFRDLLLVRYWQREGENDSAAFVIRLQISKNVGHPDREGWFMHIVYAAHDPLSAAADSAAMVERLIKATAADYCDVSSSRELRFAPWSAPPDPTEHSRAV